MILLCLFNCSEAPTSTESGLKDKKSVYLETFYDLEKSNYILSMASLGLRMHVQVGVYKFYTVVCLVIYITSYM